MIYFLTNCEKMQFLKVYAAEIIELVSNFAATSDCPYLPKLVTFGNTFAILHTSCDISKVSHTTAICHTSCSWVP